MCIISLRLTNIMSDPTILTTVTEIPKPCKPSGLSKIASKVPSILWLIIIVLCVVVILMFMWQRGDRKMLVMIQRNQQQHINTQDCAAMIEESIMEYDRQKNQIADPRLVQGSPQPLQSQEEEDDDDEDDGEMSVEEESSDDDEDTFAEEEEEEDDDLDEPPDLPSPPSVPAPSSNAEK